jgi:hypothetical protein
MTRQAQSRFTPRAGVAIVLLLGATRLAEAQAPDTISTQSRIRIDFVSSGHSRFGRARTQTVIGTTTDLRRDTLLLTMEPGADPIRVPRSSISGAYLSRGQMPRWEAGIRGAVIPALVGAALSAAASGIRRRPGDPTPAQSALSSAAWGGLSGAALGAWSPEERWRPIPSAQGPRTERAYSPGVSP